MFLGHMAVGFAAKRAAPRASLGVLLGAAMLPDFIWPLLLLAGVEQVRVDPGNTAVTPLAFVEYPISHSLAAVAVWGALAAGLYLAWARYRAGAAVVGLAVVSHWLLDALVHRPDLPLYPGSAAHAGLGLWDWAPGTLAVEGGLFIAGVWLYAAGTRSRNRAGSAGLWGFVALVALIYAGNFAGPPPPDARAVAVVGLAALLFPAWAAWFDRHREARAEVAPRRQVR